MSNTRQRKRGIWGGGSKQKGVRHVRSNVRPENVFSAFYRSIQTWMNKRHVTELSTGG